MYSILRMVDSRVPRRIFEHRRRKRELIKYDN
jgi:hypothetical protein